MPNSYFQFKEFIIRQDQCAMKVCTDSCLFGAWVASELKHKADKKINILDIGAGTGLLSLMLAQKLSSAIVDAVDLEPLCFVQAKQNISLSHWKERIQVHHTDISQFSSEKKYDVIISNPPFFESDLLSGNVARNIAHHNAGLTLQILLTVVKKFVNEDGCIAVLLPYHRSVWFENLAEEEGLFVNKKICVKQTPTHSFFRTFLIFSKKKTSVLENEIIIKDSNNQYTNKFIALLKDYYPYL